MINAYAPTSNAEDKKMEQFYDYIEKAMADSGSKYKIITGNFKAKIGTKTKEDFKIMGAFGIGERNERGDRLTEFAEAHKLIIGNTQFQKQKQNKTKQNKTNKQTNKNNPQTNNNQKKKKQNKPQTNKQTKNKTKPKTNPDTGLGCHPMGKRETKLTLH